MNNKFDLIFATIAMREVIFFSAIADKLQQQGKKLAFITFYEPGLQYFKEKGYHAYSIHQEVKDKTKKVSQESVNKVQSEYNFRMRDIILHEKFTFNRYDETKLIEKTLLYLDFYQKFFKENQCDCVIQELGGFIAPLTLYYSAKRFGVNHFFIEPSMIKGRVFLTHNAIECQLNQSQETDTEIKQAITKLMKEYREDKTVNIPAKDVHHFHDAKLTKLLNKNNVIKLTKKIWYKYILGQKEEYNAIGNHVKRALGMYINRHQLGSYYSSLNEADKHENYVFYPFHVPLDFQLTVRSNEYLDQIALLKYIANVLPYGWFIYVKEHPAAIGAYTKTALEDLLKNQNVKLLHPTINAYDVIQKAKCIITVNSKVGAEALMQGKSVFVLGKAFYRNQCLTVDLNSLDELKEHFYLLAQNNTSPAPEKMQVSAFLTRVYESSYLGELYDNSEDNIAAFAESMNHVITDISQNRNTK